MTKYRCPYNKTYRCSMEKPCKGCKVKLKGRRREFSEMEVGDPAWIAEGPFANRKLRDRMEAYFVTNITEHSIVLCNGRKFSRMTGEERGKAAQLWMTVPKPRWKAILLANDRRHLAKEQYHGGKK